MYWINMAHLSFELITLCNFTFIEISNVHCKETNSHLVKSWKILSSPFQLGCLPTFQRKLLSPPEGQKLSLIISTRSKYLQELTNMIYSNETHNIWLPLRSKLCYVDMWHKWWINVREYDLKHTIWNVRMWTIHTTITALVWELVVIKRCTAQMRYNNWSPVFRKSNYGICK